MIYTKHIGIYVNDIEKEKDFYKNVFQMEVLCDAICDQNEMLGELFHNNNGKALITKLITPFGKKTGIGEMVELVKFVDSENTKGHLHEIYELGVSHICFGVDDINKIIENIKENGGIQKTKIYKLGEKCCSFCTDPEGNWLELISQ